MKTCINRTKYYTRNEIKSKEYFGQVFHIRFCAGGTPEMSPMRSVGSSGPLREPVPKARLDTVVFRCDVERLRHAYGVGS